MLYPSTLWDTTMNQKNLTQKLIVSLLTLQMILLGIQAKNRIQQGDSTIEVLIPIVNHTTILLNRIKSKKTKESNK